MKFIITADWHFGFPSKLNDLKWSFMKMIEYCENHSIQLILMLGDLTHDREYLTHDVSNCLSECLDYMNNKGIQMICLVGNHDMYMRHKWSINAIKPFSKQLTLVDDISYFETQERKFWMVPFIEHEPSYMKVIKKISEISSEDDVLLTHIGLTSATLNVCFLVQNWNAISFEESKFSRVYAGHFHAMQQVGSKSWVPGGPIPFNFDEGLIEHGFFVYDSVKNNHDFIPIFDLSEDDDERPCDYITAMSEDIQTVINNCRSNNVKIILKESDDKDEIIKRLKSAGANKITFVKPKEKSPEFLKTNKLKSNSIFESWVKHDNPEHLNHNLLISLEKEIRSQTRIEEDYD